MHNKYKRKIKDFQQKKVRKKTVKIWSNLKNKESEKRANGKEKVKENKKCKNRNRRYM